MKTRLHNRPLIKSVLALSSSALFSRIMGTVYRIALVRAAGQDAIGIVQLAMPVYRIARSIATLGLPIAIAKCTAERSSKCGKPDMSPYRLGLLMMIRASLVGFLVQALFSNFWAQGVLTDPRTEPALVVLATLLVPIAVSSAMRGVVQGLQKQNYLATSDVVEVLVRIPCTLALVKFASPYGPEWIAAAVTVGFIIGELGSMAMLQIGIRQAKRGIQQQIPRPSVKHDAMKAGELLRLGLPLMVTGVLNNVMNLITVALIPRLLQTAGLTLMEATRAYGRLSGMAIPTLYMPMMLVFPVTQVVLPEITRLVAQPKGSGKTRIRKLLFKAFAGTGLIALFVAPALWYQADWLAKILYADASIGSLIKPLAFAAPFAFFGAISSGVLYGLGWTTWTMVSSLAGNLARLVIVYVLAGKPEWGIMGALWAFVADYALTTILQAAGVAWALRKVLR